MNTVALLFLMLGLSLNAMADLQVAAHWGVHIPFRSGTEVGGSACIAELIDSPSKFKYPYRYMIDNTIPSITSAFRLGAGLVTVNLRVTKDGHVVLFHDEELDCRTNGSGPVAETRLEEIKKLNAAWNFTPDHGASYPWRDARVVAAGFTSIPELSEVLNITQGKGFWFVVRPRSLRALRTILKELQKYPDFVKQSQLYFPPSARSWIEPVVKELLPQIKVPRVDFAASKDCIDNFVPGQSLPPSCADLDLFLPVEALKKLGNSIAEFGEKLKELPQPSFLYADFVNTIQDADFILRNAKGISGFGTDRIEVVGPYIEAFR